MEAGSAILVSLRYPYARTTKLHARQSGFDTPTPPHEGIDL